MRQSKWLLYVLIPFIFPLPVHAAVLTMQFFTYTQMRLPEQDVFVQSKDNPEEVIRVNGEDITPFLYLSLFALKTQLSGSLFDIRHQGKIPFPKGKSLGFTLGDWLSASGSGTYDDNSEKPSFSLTFQKLIPNARYIVWCSRLALPPQITTKSQPCGRTDWSNDSFQTDAAGNGTVYTPLASPLAPSRRNEATVISVVYQSDGQVGGNTLDTFGVTSHTQLTYFLPSFEAVNQQTEDNKPLLSVLCGMVLIGLVLTGLFIWFVWSKNHEENFN